MNYAEIVLLKGPTSARYDFVSCIICVSAIASRADILSLSGSNISDFLTLSLFAMDSTIESL